MLSLGDGKRELLKSRMDVLAPTLRFCFDHALAAAELGRSVMEIPDDDSDDFSTNIRSSLRAFLTKNPATGFRLTGSTQCVHLIDTYSWEQLSVLKAREHHGKLILPVAGQNAKRRRQWTQGSLDLRTDADSGFTALDDVFVIVAWTLVNGKINLYAAHPVGPGKDIRTGAPYDFLMKLGANGFAPFEQESNDQLQLTATRENLGKRQGEKDDVRLHEGKH